MPKAFRVFVTTMVIVSLQVMPSPSYASKADGDGFVPDDPQPISWKPSKESAERNPSSRKQPAASQKGAPRNSFPRLERKHFAVAGKQYMLMKRRAPDGRVLETNLISDDYTEIARDPKGRGFMNSWEFVTRNRRIHMHEPRNGHFDVMEIEEVTPKFIYSMRLNRTREGKYRLFSVKPHPNVPQFSLVQRNVKVGCDEAEPELKKLADGVMEKVLSNEGRSLNEIMDRDDGFLDKSCKTGDFAKSAQAIKDGIREVFMSDRNSKGMYLQCLRNHNLETHASRIEAALATYFRMPDQQFYWKVKCGTNVTNKEAENIWGMYQNSGTSAPTISLFNQVDKNWKVLDRKSPPDPTYAQTFFHEMLHYSLIPDGDLHEAVEGCCSESKAGACAKLDDLVKHQAYAQAASNIGVQSHGETVYGDWAQRVRELSGDAQNGDVIREGLEDKIGQVYARLTQGGCKFGKADVVKTDEKTKACLDKLTEGIQDEIDQTFGKDKNDKNKQYLRAYATYVYNGDGKSMAEICPRAPVSFWDNGHSLIERARMALGLLIPIVIAEEKVNKCDILPDQVGNGSQAWRAIDPSATTPALPQRSMQPGQSAGSVADDSSGMSTFSSAPIDDLKDRAGSSGRGGTFGTPISDTNGSRRYPQQASDGPPRPRYEEDKINGRPQAILSDIETYKRTNNEADSLVRDLVKNTVVSEAKAAPETGSSGRRLGGSRDDGGVKVASYDVSVPQRELSDPLAHRASIVNAGVNVESGSKDDGGTGSARVAKSSRVPMVSGGTRAPASIAGGGQGEDPSGGVDQRAARTASVPAGTARTDAGSPIRHGANSGSGSSKGGGSAKPGQRLVAGSAGKKDAASSDLAANVFLKRLQSERYFDVVKPELRIPATKNSMQRHKVQVKDDEGKVHGSSTPRPDRVLFFCKSESRLRPPGKCKK